MSGHLRRALRFRGALGALDLVESLLFGLRHAPGRRSFLGRLTQARRLFRRILDDAAADHFRILDGPARRTDGRGAATARLRRAAARRGAPTEEARLPLWRFG